MHRKSFRKEKNLSFCFELMVFSFALLLLPGLSLALNLPSQLGEASLSEIESFPHVKTWNDLTGTAWVESSCDIRCKGCVMGYENVAMPRDSLTIDFCVSLWEHYDQLSSYWKQQAKCCINTLKSSLEVSYCWRHESWGARCHVINSAKAIKALLLAGQCPGDELWKLNSMQSKEGYYPTAEEWEDCDYKSTLYALSVNLLAKEKGCWAKNRDEAIQKATNWLNSGGKCPSSTQPSTTPTTTPSTPTTTQPPTTPSGGETTSSGLLNIPTLSSVLEQLKSFFQSLISILSNFFRMPTSSASTGQSSGSSIPSTQPSTPSTTTPSSTKPSSTSSSGQGNFNIDCCCLCGKTYKWVSIHGDCPYHCCMNCYDICEDECKGNPVSFGSCASVYECRQVCWPGSFKA